MDHKKNDNGVLVAIAANGRIVIPKIYRKALDITDDKEVLLILDDNKIIIKKKESIRNGERKYD